LWLIKIVIGTEAVGLFSVAQGLVVNLVSLLPLNKILASTLPQHVDDRERFDRMLNKSIKYQVLGYALIAFVAFFAVPPFIAYLFPTYVNALPLFAIMVFAMIPMGFSSVTAAYYALKSQYILTILLVIKLIVMFATLPIFVYYFGFYGIGVEYVFSIALNVLIRNIMLKRVLPGYRLPIKAFITFDAYDREVLRKIMSFVKLKVSRT
jgi:O-antigen/teichoic acid export membrane protein